MTIFNNLCLTKSTKLLVMILCVTFLSASNASFAQRFTRPSPDKKWQVTSEDDNGQERVETLDEWQERISEKNKGWGTKTMLAVGGAGTVAAIYFGGKYLYNRLFPRRAMAPTNPPINGADNLPPMSPDESERMRQARLAFFDNVVHRIPSAPILTSAPGSSVTVVALPPQTKQKQQLPTVIQTTDRDLTVTAAAAAHQARPRMEVEPPVELAASAAAPLTRLEQIENELEQVNYNIMVIRVDHRSDPNQEELLIGYEIKRLSLLIEINELLDSKDKNQKSIATENAKKLIDSLKYLDHYLTFNRELVIQALLEVYKEESKDIQSHLEKAFETENYSERFAIIFADIPPGNLQTFLLAFIKGLNIINHPDSQTN